jgi:UDP-3-O-acyl-N-acetylglucosamine deacetylase
MPGCDGSALAFVEALDAAGVVEQGEPARRIRVRRTIRVGDGTNWIEARPPRGDGLSVSFELDYGSGNAIGRQTIRLDVHQDSFRTELAPCRTFLLEDDAKAMLAAGMGQRVTQKDLLIFGPRGPIGNKLRFANECVRHKVLDVVGDLALTGCVVEADIVACRSGHKLHAELARRLMEQAGVAHPLIKEDRRLCA